MADKSKKANEIAEAITYLGNEISRLSFGTNEYPGAVEKIGINIETVGGEIASGLNAIAESIQSLAAAIEGLESNK